jgi:hypothetical protein
MAAAPVSTAVKASGEGSLSSRHMQLHTCSEPHKTGQQQQAPLHKLISAALGWTIVCSGACLFRQ